MFGLSHKQMLGVAVVSVATILIVRNTPLSAYIPV
jgi:hypothetical protein